MRDGNASSKKISFEQFLRLQYSLVTEVKNVQDPYVLDEDNWDTYAMYFRYCANTQKNKTPEEIQNEVLKMMFKHQEIYVEKKSESGEKCPYCGAITNVVKAHKVRTIEGEKNGITPVFYKYKEKEYHCSSCDKSFIEENEDFPQGIKKFPRQD